tara:strand:+ start:1153 stop:1761 length:609 start_codon:yes stop_codon:yes gene_type:complete
MSTLNVSNLVTRDLEDDLAFKTNNTTRMLLTSAGTLSGAGGSITNFTGVGKVLQVVSFTTDTISTTTSTSLANTAVTAAITPSSTSSKIFVNASVCAGSNSDQNNIMGFALRRDTTDIGLSTTASSNRKNVTAGPGQTGEHFLGSISLTSLDSPNTTSEVDYYVTFLARSGYTTQINRSGADADQAYTYRGSSTITLMEISG